MANEFTGQGFALDQGGMSQVCDALQVQASEIWTVVKVETRGCGFLADRRPVILFERHIFSRETEGRFDDLHSDISNRTPGGYGAGGANQYDRLCQAMALDRKAALRSASWGIGQVMGFNAEIAGYPDVETMVDAMTRSENDQILAMASFLTSKGLDRHLRNYSWDKFAYGYNGSAYKKNNYDGKLKEFFEIYSEGQLPDLVVRAAQLYLTYLGYQPGPVDGLVGSKTRKALNSFMAEKGMPMTDMVDNSVSALLKDAIYGVHS